MEGYYEYSCPYCHETMQVPADRNRIKCMFCGRDIIVAGSSFAGGGSSFDYDYYKKSIDEATPAIIEARDRYYKRFNRDSYRGALDEFCREFSAFLDAMEAIVVYSTAGDEGALRLGREFPTEFARRAFDMVMTSPKKRERMQANEGLNLYVVSFVLPAIEELGSERMEALLDDVCLAWRETFPIGGIGHTGYEVLAKGFKKGIFGLFSGRF